MRWCEVVLGFTKDEGPVIPGLPEKSTILELVLVPPKAEGAGECCQVDVAPDPSLCVHQ